MKKLLVIFAATLFFTSCQKDGPTTREDYIGAWTCDETSTQLGKTTFTVHLKEGSGTDQILIENFYNFGFGNMAKATVTEDEITIPKQTFSGSNEVSGSGTMLSKTKINLSYTVKDSSGTDNVTAVLTKQ